MIQVDGIFVQGGGGPVVPDFTYTGEYQLLNEDGGNWKLYLITSGTFNSNVDMLVDICLIGGGQAGQRSNYVTPGTCGNPGSLLTNKNIVIQAGMQYQVNIGSGGGITTAIGSFGLAGGNTEGFGLTALGGQRTSYIATEPEHEFGDTNEPTQAAPGGNGGQARSGGNGLPGSDGASAGNAQYPEPGGAGGPKTSPGSAGSRGAQGGDSNNANPSNGGGGGGGGGFGASGGGGAGTYASSLASFAGGEGAPGVAIIRNARGAAA